MKKILPFLFSLIFVFSFATILTGCNQSDEIKVSIYYNNGINEKIVQNIKNGDVVQLPDMENIDAPAEFLSFDCWCTSSSLAKEFDQEKKIEKDTNIYARWKLKEDFSWLKILSRSMAEFNLGDIIILTNVNDSTTLSVGDNISYYAYYPTSGVPTKQEAIDNNANIYFHQIVGITDAEGNIYYETKGTNNAINDLNPVSKTLVLGKYYTKIENKTLFQKYTGIY